MPEAADSTIESTYEIPVLGEKPKEGKAPAVAPAASADPKADAQDTGDQESPAKPEGEKPEEVALTPEQEAKRAGRRFERKLDKAFRQRAEAQARADFLERQLNEVRSTAPKEDAGAPKLEQFDYDPEKYAKAFAEHTLRTAARNFDARQKAEIGKQAQQRLVSEWDKKVERGSDKYDDWQQTVGDFKPDSPLTAAISEAENGDDIAYYLGKNPQEAERIVQLSPRSQVREIGKLEAKLLSEPPKVEMPSNAPAPIKPVGGSSSPSTKKMYDMTQDEFEKKRRAQIAARR